MNDDNRITAKRPRLTIRIGAGALAFAAADATAAQQAIYEPYTVKSGISMAANLREAFRTGELPAREWQRAQVLVDTPVLMMPIEEYDSAEFNTVGNERCAQLYRHAMTGRENDVVLSTVVPALNAVAVFSINKDLKMVVDDRFADVRYNHVCIPVWNTLYKRSFSGLRRKLYGYFHDKQADIFCFNKNRFRFTNSFSVTKAHDAAYFLLYVWQQVGFDQRKDELHLVGMLPEREELLAELRRFLKNVYVINPTAEFNRAPMTQIKGMPFDLMAMYLKG